MASKWAAYSRAKRERRKAAGVCLMCGRPRDNDSLSCARCLDRMRVRSQRATERKRATRPPKPVPVTADINAYRRARRASVKAAGVCTTCGGVRDIPGKVRCRACQAKDRADYRRVGRERYERRADEVNGRVAEQRRQWGVAGLCTGCGGERDMADRIRCSACNLASRLHLKRQRHDHIAAGVCSKCGKGPPANGRLCDHCRKRGREEYRKAYARDPQRLNSRRDRRRAHMAAGGVFTAAEWRSIKAAQGYTCLRCGRREPEIRLTVDHVIPLSRGGPNVAANVQGLCGPCNKAKGSSSTDYRCTNR
jgi:5-methylcytosine-specific restriction protein A